MKSATALTASLAEPELELTEALEIFRHARRRIAGRRSSRSAQPFRVPQRGQRAKRETADRGRSSCSSDIHPARSLRDAYTRRAGTHAVATRPHEALAAVDLALPIVQEFGLKSLEARLLQYRGIARFDLGDFEGADDIKAGMELGREIGDLGTVGIGYSNLGSLLLVLSPQEALAAFDEGREFTSTQRNGWKQSLADCRIDLGALRPWTLGRAPRASRRGRRVRRGVRTRLHDDRGASPESPRAPPARRRRSRPQPSWRRLSPRRVTPSDLQVLVPALAVAAMVAATHRRSSRRRTPRPARSSRSRKSEQRPTAPAIYPSSYRLRWRLLRGMSQTLSWRPSTTTSDASDMLS